MENYYGGAASYPDSGDSSPRSREIDFENPPPWEDQGSQPSPNYKVKFMCSYGGSITPRPHDNQLSYVGGETKILSVERNVKFYAFISKLSALCETEVCFKYQLPGEDLDALISVTDDDDLEHMMHEYDRLFKGLAKPARLRLFLFDVHGNSRSETERPRSTEPKTDRERFVEALNSGPSSVDGSSPHCPQPILPGNNVDFLFAIDRGGSAAAAAVQPVVAPAPVVHVPQPEIRRDERIVGSDPVEIQRRIVELQRMQIGNEQAAMYQQQRMESNMNNNSNNNLVTGYPTDFYKLPEKLPPANVQQGYWQETTKQMPTSGYPATITTTAPQENPPPQQQQQQQPVYMIPAQGEVYQAQMRTQAQVTSAPAGQGGFYAVSREPQIYREQQQQQVHHQQQQVHLQQQQIQQQVHHQQQQIQQQIHHQQQQVHHQQQQVHQQQQQMYNVVTQVGPKMVQTYPPEMVRQNVVSGGMADNVGSGYSQVAYDNPGRQVYYTAAPPTAYHPAQGIAVSADMRPTAGGMMGQPEGKVVVTKLP